MRYKVLSLEGQAALDGQDLSSIKILDELRLAKKELQSELETAKTQLKGFKILLSQN